MFRQADGASRVQFRKSVSVVTDKVIIHKVRNYNNISAARFKKPTKAKSEKLHLRRVKQYLVDPRGYT